MRTSTSSIAIALLLIGAVSAPLAAQNPYEEQCGEVVAQLNRSITEAWDSPEQLTSILADWTGTLRASVEFFDPKVLADMTADEVEQEKLALLALRDCLPRIEAAFNRLKRRLDELGAQPGTVGSDARRDRERVADLREAERVHAEVARAVARILGGRRAGGPVPS